MSHSVQRKVFARERFAVQHDKSMPSSRLRTPLAQNAMASPRSVDLDTTIPVPELTEDIQVRTR
jgi:hypothetical protein